MLIHKMGVSPGLPGGGDRLRDPAGLWGKKKPGLTSSALTPPFRTGEGGWAWLLKPGESWNYYLMPPRASQGEPEPDPARP